MRGAPARVGVRWTVGDVSPSGFEALRLSVWGAWRLFGPSAAYVVCVNSVPLAEARARTGPLPGGVEWQNARADMLGPFARHLDPGMAEGVGWKFAPVRVFPDRFEIALDNDCVLWALPEAMDEWFARCEPDLCLIAEDVAPYFGQFAHLCGPLPRNSGIRGVPPGLDLDGRFARLLRENPVTLVSETDEQGLQVAAVSLTRPSLVVSTDDVAICSPFPPHRPDLGRCGAHFVGLNARRLPWDYEGRNAAAHIQAHWRGQRGAVYERVGIRPA